MNSKVSKIIAGIAASIISLGVIFYIINAIDSLTDLAEFEEEFFSSLRGLSVFQLIAAITILLMGITTIVISFVPTMSKKAAISSLLATSIVIALEKLVSMLGIYIISKHYYGPYVSLNATSIILIVFDSLSLLCLLTALSLNQSNKKIPASSLGVAGATWFLIVLIIAMASGSNTSGMTIIYLVFILIATLMMIITYAFNAFSDVSKPVGVNPVNVSHTSNKSSDSAEELLKLKKLLDAGAITQEEYEEKRKKYVDSL